jgi:hypothetical protein
MIAELFSNWSRAVLNVNGGLMKRKRAFTVSALSAKGLSVRPLHDKKIGNT